MSIIRPEIEYVDRASHSIRYLEHGWPTDLCRWHAHEEYELHLIVRTRGKAFVGDFIGEFEPGCFYLTGPNLPHNWITHDASTAQVPVRDKMIQFNDTGLRALVTAFPEFAEIETLFKKARSGIQFVGFNREVAETHMDMVRDLTGPDRILAFLRLLMAVVAHPDKKVLSVTVPAEPGKSDRHARIGTVVDYIAAHYSDNFTVEQVAELAGMSTSAFTRNFQAVTGNRFVEFVNRVRIGQACSLLYETDDQVSAICFEVGFQNLANFNRQFLRMKDMTPSEYRETARRELVATAPLDAGAPA